MTNSLRSLARRIAAPALAGLLALAAASADAATITIVNNNAAGVGFNDPTPVAPVGGNPGTTLGAQRLYLFQYAASIWGSLLPSNVVILVRSQFAAQTCSATSAVLGSAGPVTIHRNFAGAPFANTWYHAALANRLSNTDLSAANPDINATFNLNIDSGCFGPGLKWYYGTDGLEGPDIELLPVLLHEMGHGLGFSTTTSGTTGNFNNLSPSVYDLYLLDNLTGLHWNAETAAQRVASAIAIDKLVWDGPSATLAANAFLAKRPRMVINSPGGIAGVYGASAASFGAPITAGGLTGNVVLVDDAMGLNPNDGCEAIVNAGAVAGNIALIDRGNCTFVIKAAAAQAAGATGLLIANNVAGPLAPGGADPTITIPVVGITQADGATIKANLGAGVNVTIGLDPVLLAGGDAAGHPMMYTPNPFQSGSSVSHWDVTLFPNALMEPAINNSLHDNVDLTLPMFDDIGWFSFLTATTLARFTAEEGDEGIVLRWQFSDPGDVSVITLQRAPAAEGPWEPIATEFASDGSGTAALDASAERGRTYYYRLHVVDRQGQASDLGLASARRAETSAGSVFLGRPSPNPAERGTSVTFRISKPEYVRLVVRDASGRTVRTIHEGMMLAGEYTRSWDGVSDRRESVPPGVYFITLGTSSGWATQRVAYLR